MNVTISSTHSTSPGHTPRVGAAALQMTAIALAIASWRIHSPNRLRDACLISAEAAQLGAGGMLLLSMTRKGARVQKRVLIRCNQWGCNGSVEREKANIILKQLQNKAPSKVTFDVGALQMRCQGGVCSAMSLEYLDRVMIWMGDRPIDSITSKEWDSTLTKITKRCRKLSMTDYRCQQAALNCITMKKGATIPTEPSRKLERFHQAKIKALCGWKDLTVTKASRVFDHKREGAKEFTQLVDGLDRGVYLIRAIIPNGSAKREEKGHTTTFIHGKEASFFFDPNVGTAALGNERTAKQLYEYLEDSFQTFETNEVRFYQISSQSGA